MSPINIVLASSYVVVYINLSALLGDLLLTDAQGYTEKWQAIAMGLCTFSLIVVGIHLVYKTLQYLNRSN